MERGTLVSWNAGSGIIRADGGDRILLFYWAVVQGFHHLTIGRRVEFSRIAGLGGLERNVAGLVVPVVTDADSN
jgi:cold shock CspA family protein